MNEWVRIPEPIASEADRRDLCAVLAGNGMAVRVVKVKETPRSVIKRFVEYAKEDEE